MRKIITLVCLASITVAAQITNESTVTNRPIVLLRTCISTNIVGGHWEGMKPEKDGDPSPAVAIFVGAKQVVVTNCIIGYIDGTNVVEIVNASPIAIYSKEPAPTDYLTVKRSSLKHGLYEAFVRGAMHQKEEELTGKSINTQKNEAIEKIMKQLTE